MPGSFPTLRTSLHGVKMSIEESKYTLMASLSGFAATMIGPSRAVGTLEIKDYKFRNTELWRSFLPPQVSSKLDFNLAALPSRPLDTIHDIPSHACLTPPMIYTTHNEFSTIRDSFSNDSFMYEWHLFLRIWIEKFCCFQVVSLMNDYPGFFWNNATCVFIK